MRCLKPRKRRACKLRTMKTSVIHVHDMLSVLSVEEVEKRIGDVPGVESVTVNYAAGSATVRYDETRLEVGDIKSAVRQREYASATPDAAPGADGQEGHTAHGAPATTTVETVTEEPKAEVAPTPPAVKPPEEKGKAATQPTASGTKAEDHAGHKTAEMSQDKAEMAQGDGTRHRRVNGEVGARDA